MKNPRTILITGASSGLGAALALYYAAPGITLHLQGRTDSRLQEIAEKCRTKGANVHTNLIDVTDAQAMEQWIAPLPLDLVIANAGISAGTGGGGESAQQVRKIFATNIDGVINTIHPALAGMLAKRSGQLAIMSSLAGIRALPSSPAYSASKACVRYYAESLCGHLLHSGVTVSTICPGYIKTPMTDVNNFPMPFLMSAKKAAKIIVKNLASGKGRIAFPLALYLPLWWISCLSPRLTDPLFAALPAKPSAE